MMKLLSLVVVCSMLAAAQEPAKPEPEMSLADRARAARKKKEAAGAESKPDVKAEKKTITNESMAASGRGSLPFPDVNTTHSNVIEIVELMRKYRREHNDKETEENIRQWFVAQDERFNRLKDQAIDKANDQRRRGEAAAQAASASAEQRRKIYASARADNQTFQDMEDEVRFLGQYIGEVRNGLRFYGFPEAWMLHSDTFK